MSYLIMPSDEDPYHPIKAPCPIKQETRRRNIIIKELGIQSSPVYHRMLYKDMSFEDACKDLVKCRKECAIIRSKDARIYKNECDYPTYLVPLIGD